MHKVLIIGCGNIAGGFDAERPDLSLPRTHAGAYRRHGGFRVVACVDPDAARRAAFQTRWDIPTAAASLNELDARPGMFDVISICSPNTIHAANLSSAVALRPKLIFCEKPITANVDEGEQLVARCDAAGVRLAVNYTRRWAPDIVRLAGELGRGDWGVLRSVTATYTKGIVHNGGHMIDLLHLLVGPMRVDAVGAAVFDYWNDDPSVPALLRSADGVPVQLSVGDARDYTLFELTLITSRAEITMRRGGLEWTIRQVEDSAAFAGYRELGAWQVVPGEYDHAMTCAVANIAGALATDEPLASHGHSALAAQRVCDAIRHAALHA